VTNGIGGTLAARDATTTIPIVFIAVREPVEHGLVASLARPGGNLTGVTNADQEFLSGKTLELLKEVAPAATRIGLLSNPDHPFFAITLQTLPPLAPARDCPALWAWASV
jgi:putative ABC transport system substrate-binding protein